ncbi:sigma-54 interaction domain-containing protein [Photobacterium indicum]|uniref:sigma-54 interaction domain-containing protein n=1 Tax=Photobacterium indicum TaxID=81447 RepID=UPI003D0B2A8A
MNKWLARAIELIGVRQSDELVVKFVNALKEELYLSVVHVLLPCPDGRQLTVVNHSQTLVWDVNDFDNPFSHVLQSASSMLLDPSRLLYWRSNPAFCALTSQTSRTDSILIIPLPPRQNQIKALLVLMGPADLIHDLMPQDDWMQFSILFICHWQMIQDMGQHVNQQTVLNESITRLRQEEHHRELSKDLTNTLIGSSEVMGHLRNQIVTAAQSELTVLVQGDTGTGKELVARAIHDLSDRNQAPFITINCAAIPENLLESELFGHEKGAFSGAECQKKGLVAEANGGTLFLDEIGDMPPLLQAKLLRVLETRQYRPVGAKEEVSSDFRLVAATHVNLRQRTESGDFRLDLYYRLYQYPLMLPTLAERIEDVSELALYFVKKFNANYNTMIRGIRYSALDHLSHCDFPGNVRELRHLIEFACTQTSTGEEVGIESFGERAVISIPRSENSTEEIEISHQQKEQYFAYIRNLKLALQNYESEIIRSRLAKFSGDRAKAAKSLGVPKRTLAYKCLKLEVES